MTSKASFKDLFTPQASDYAKFRPTYPKALFDYLATLPIRRDHAWDVGTGSGQAAVKLAEYFSKVTGTDPTASQIQNAKAHPHVEYVLASAEQSKLAGHSVDLVTVAQAFHWFRHEEFFREVRRVCRPKGSVIALWSYNLAKISPEVDRVVHHYYDDILGPYWEPERKLVEGGYRGVKFPFEELTPPAFEMQTEWSFAHLVGYLGTWSALHTYLKKQSRNPLEDLVETLQKAWGTDAQKTVHWPLAVRVGKVTP